MIKVYITDLAAYNKGFLIGEWISLPLDQNDLKAAIKKTLRGGEAICAIEYGYEPHEEWFISDYEWEDVDLFTIDEYEDIYALNEKLTILEVLNIDHLKGIRFLLDERLANSFDDAISKLEDVIIYNNTNLKDYAYELMEELYDLNKLPSLITSNIDYEGIAKDLSFEGRYYEVDGDLYEYIN